MCFPFVKIPARNPAENRSWPLSLDGGRGCKALIPTRSLPACHTVAEGGLSVSRSDGLLQALLIEKASLFSTLLPHW